MGRAGHGVLEDRRFSEHRQGGAVRLQALDALREGRLGGAGLDVVKELLGHASIRSTERYLHPGLDAQREAVERLGPLQFGKEPR